MKTLFLKKVSFSPRQGCSFIALPSNLRNCRSPIINRNIFDENCFFLFYCCIPISHGWTSNSNKLLAMQEKPDTYNPSSNHLAKKHLGDFPTPMPVNQIDRFQKLNEVQINVFRFEGKDLVPLKVSKEYSNFVMDLLIISEGCTHHNVLITDLKHFASFVKYNQSRLRDEIRRHCFHVCSSLESLKNHKLNCYGNEAARVYLPDEKKKLHQFKSKRATWFWPLVVCFDTEGLLVPIHECSPAPNASRQMTLEKHVPCGYAIVIVEHGNDKNWWYRIKRETNCLEDFMQELKKSQRHLQPETESSIF